MHQTLAVASAPARGCALLGVVMAVSARRLAAMLTAASARRLRQTWLREKGGTAIKRLCAVAHHRIAENGASASM